MKAKLIMIANYLMTESRGKKHGSYHVYKDDKIEIAYDTYYPNVDVHVFIDGERKTAAIYSGHGTTQEYHNGAWTKYVEDVLYPKAVKAKADHEAAIKERDRQQQAKKFGALDDKSVFEAKP